MQVLFDSSWFKLLLNFCVSVCAESGTMFILETGGITGGGKSPHSFIDTVFLPAITLKQSGCIKVFQMSFYTFKTQKRKKRKEEEKKAETLRGIKNKAFYSDTSYLMTASYSQLRI